MALQHLSESCNFSWINEGPTNQGASVGLLAGMRCPKDANEVAMLYDVGVRCIVTLLEVPLQDDLFTQLSDPGAMHRVHIPVEDFGAPTIAQAQQFVAVADEELHRGNVVVHCRAGIGRTGTMLSCWSVVHLRDIYGDDVESVLAFLRPMRKGVGEVKLQRIFIEQFADQYYASNPSKRPTAERSSEDRDESTGGNPSVGKL